MALTAEAIVFAIHSAIRLGRNAQRAYAKSLTSRSIVLPLPQFSGTANAFTAERFFDSTDERTGGAQYLSQIERLADIHQRFKNGEGAAFPSDAELSEYIDYYKQLSQLLREEASLDYKDGLRDDRINADELVALLRIRQYQFDPEKHTRPLQLVAGTLVELGIDYFNQIPGAVNEQSTTGKVLKHFLGAIDEIPFSDKAKMRRHSPKILPQLFISAAEAVSSLSSDLASDPKVQAFIQSVGQGIAEDLFDRLEGLDPDRQDQAMQWGRLMLRSAIANSGRYVTTDPTRLFDTNAGATALIKSTGTVLLDAILQDPHRLDLKAGFNLDTLDRLLQTSFTVFAEYPALMGGGDGFRRIVSDVSAALSEYSFRRPDYLPELLRLVVGYTGQHLDLVWQPRTTGGGDRLPELPAEQAQQSTNLFITALKIILIELSRPVDGGEWKPRFSKPRLLAMTNELLDAVLANPGWINHKIGNKPLLNAVIRITIDTLAEIPREQRLTGDTFERLLELNLQAVAANEVVLLPLKWSNDEQEKAVLQQAISLVFAYVFRKPHLTAGNRFAMAMDLTQYVLDVIVTRHPDKRGLVLTNLILLEVDDVHYSGGFDRQLANALVDAGLDVLAAHPDLISRREALAHIAAGVAGALDASSFRRADLLPELIRLTLKNTALNANLVVKAPSSEPTYLLVTFLKEFLLAISHKDEDEGRWQPDLTPTETFGIVDGMMAEACRHPEWIVAGPDGRIVLREVLTAVRQSLQHLPPGQRLEPQMLRQVITLCLYTAAGSSVVLQTVRWADDEKEEVIIKKALDLVVGYVYPATAAASPQRLRQFLDLLDYSLGSIIATYPDKRCLLLLDMLFFDSNIDLEQGFNKDLAEDLVEAALDIMVAHPELVLREEVFRKILQDVSGALRASRVELRYLLPEFFRLVLNHAAGHLESLMNISPNSPRILLAVALEQTLRIITQKRRGKWSPTLSDEQVLDLVEIVMAKVVANPQWMGGNKPVQITMEAMYTAMGEIRNGAALPYETVALLVDAGLEAVGKRQQLVINFVDTQGGERKLVLTYALEGLFVELYDTQHNSPGAWTLTQKDNIQQILTHFLLRLSAGPADQATVDAVTQPIRDALATINNNLSFTLEGLLNEIDAA